LSAEEKDREDVVGLRELWERFARERERETTTTTTRATREIE